MALKAGRVGLASELVDEFGYLTGEMPTGEYYTKSQTDNKFETKTHVNNNFQKKALEVPLETLMGSKLTVEDSLDALNEIQKTRQPKTLELPLETLMGSKLTVEDSLDALNEIQKTRQPKTLELPLETLMGSKLTVEDSLDALNEIQKTRQPITLAVPLEMLSGTKLTVESALQGLNEEKFERAEQRVLGAKNRLYIPNQTKTLNNVTAVVNDGIISFSGTNSSSSAIWIDLTCKIKKGTYKFSGIDVLQDVNNIIQILTAVGGTTIAQISTSTPEVEFTLDNDFEGVVYCRISGDGDTDNIKANLMLRLASDPDDTYVPFAMTNSELTDNVFIKRIVSNADNMNDITETGIYTVTSQPTNCPFSYGSLIVEHVGASTIRQIGFKINKTSAGAMYVRLHSDGTWGNWYYTSISDAVS